MRSGGQRLARRGRNPWWLLLIVVIAGALLGSVIADAVVGYPVLSFLSRDVRAGIDPPFSFDLRVATLTFGATLRLNLAILVGIVLAVWIFRLLQ
ncbi:MAG TPA: DUF4321 domain-containing protein [bacterium]|jgi:hypothetical protein|nr:DUF4321 domain-containing protein [bacterium]